MRCSDPTAASRPAAAGDGGETQHKKRSRPGSPSSVRFEASSASSLSLSEVERRLRKLEQLAGIHDDRIRTLEQRSTFCGLATQQNEIAATLAAKMRDWTQARPQKGAHPWGPPRRVLAFELIQWILAQNKLDKSSEWVKYHSTVEDCSEIDARSVNLMIVKETKDGNILIKLRPYQAKAAEWIPALQLPTDSVVADKGELKLDKEPPGPVVRKMMGRD